jgi:N-acyl-D-aspartate/D-glutamate deacylase
MPFLEGMIRRTFLTGVGLAAFPGWDEPMALAPRERLALLRDPAQRTRLAALAATIPAGPIRKFTNWGSYVICETFSPQTGQYAGRSVGEIAQAEGKDPFDALLDIVCADELETVFGWPLRDDAPGDWEACIDVCRDERVVIGGSDAGAHLDSVETFKYATAFLRRVRRNQGPLSLEEAVRLLSSAPAALYGLRGRGTLVPGSAADVVVFDADTIEPEPVTTRYDLPAGAGRLYGGARGVEHVIVNGAPIVEQGAFTQSRPGRLLRSGRDTRTPALV